jgi:hypothetical protein
MDEYFAAFLKEFGPAIDRRDVPASQLQRYRGRLPDQLLAYWEEHGWSGYGKGLFWTVNPDEYEPALAAWIGATSLMEEDAYHVIARSAFGDLYLFGECHGGRAHIIAPDSQMVPLRKGKPDRDLSIRSFFASQSRAACDFSDAHGTNLFAAARAKLGTLQHDEMYGFAPALALGGPATIDHLHKVKAVEHLVLLAQLAELRVLDTPPR